MKKLQTNLALSVGAFVLCLAPYQPILADGIVPDGDVGVSYCFEIENLEKYPEYLFIAFAASENPSHPVDHAIVKPNECFMTIGYRPISRVYALPKSAVKQEDIIAAHRPEEGEGNDILIYAVPKTGVKQREIIASRSTQEGEEILPKIKGLDEKDSRLIPSNLVIEHWGIIPIVSAGSRQLAKVYEIVSLSPKQLELKEQRIIDREPSPEQRIIDRKPQLSILGILFGGLVATGVVIFRRRKHPK